MYSAVLGAADPQNGGGGPIGASAVAVDAAGDAFVAGQAGTSVAHHQQRLPESNCRIDALRNTVRHQGCARREKPCLFHLLELCVCCHWPRRPAQWQCLRRRQRGRRHLSNHLECLSAEYDWRRRISHRTQLHRNQPRLLHRHRRFLVQDQRHGLGCEWRYLARSADLKSVISSRCPHSKYFSRSRLSSARFRSQSVRPHRSNAEVLHLPGRQRIRFCQQCRNRPQR